LFLWCSCIASLFRL